MPARSSVRDWVAARPPRSFFRTGDVPGPPRMVETALSRMAAEDAGPVIRVRHGLYWVKPPSTRFGTGRPDPAAAGMAIAGRGAGPAGWSAAQVLGLSTQVPAVPVIAVLGRPPKGIDGVQFVSRSNLERRGLTPTEIAALEVLRDFPDYTDPGIGWSDVEDHLRTLVAQGRIDPARLLMAARFEHRAGLHDRARRLLAA